jgi:hypothetical protein
VDRVSTDRERQSKRCSAVGGLSTSPALYVGDDQVS